MKILSLTYEYPPIGGGGSVVAAALNQQLVREGYEVQVVTSKMAGLAATEVVRDVTVHRAPCLRRYRHYTTTAELMTTLPTAWSRAAEVIEKFQPDLIHTHFAVPSGVVARSLSKRYGIPYVLTLHGSDIPGYNPDRFHIAHALIRPWWRKVMRDAAAVTSPSEYLAGLAHEHIDVPIRVVPNGYSADHQLGRSKRKLVLVVTRLFPRKGVQHFIESLRGLDSDWDFVVAGDGPQLAELKAQAAEARVNIDFVGFIDKRRLCGLYEEAKILVFPSLRENFPMVLLEAMDAGCAVITTDAEGCAEVVGDTGIVVPCGDPQEIRRALLELKGDEPRCEQLGGLARARARQFRWPRIAALYREVFDDVAKRRTTDLIRAR